MLKLRNRANKLFRIADSQQGLFTIQQAVEAGFNASNVSYHVTAGNWIREYRGIYRLANYPQSNDSELITWSLWSRGRNQVPQGVYSHQTALNIYGLTDLMPGKLHMTVPPTFRRSIVPNVLILHRRKLSQDDVQARRGFAVTKVRRTIEDLLDAKSLPQETLKEALELALRRGLISTREVLVSDRMSLRALVSPLIG
jgi:predicted transcriptional regulator of viral defense system